MKKVAILILFSVLIFPVNSQASIVINEILADPAPGIAGDANGDGVRSSSQDEFVELLNISSNAITISGWYITDNDRIRHIFSTASQILANQYFVVFGSTASTGTLSLNNAGDVVSLFDHNDVLMSQITYGSEGGQNQSLVRFPEGVGDFQFHSEVSTAGELFSPGEETHLHRTTVPEAVTFTYISLGLIGLIGRKRRRA